MESDRHVAPIVQLCPKLCSFESIGPELFLVDGAIGIDHGKHDMDAMDEGLVSSPWKAFQVTFQVFEFPAPLALGTSTLRPSLLLNEA